MSLTAFLFRSPAGPPGCEPEPAQDLRSTHLSRRLPSQAGPFSPATWQTCGLSPGTHQTSPSSQSRPARQRPGEHTGKRAEGITGGQRPAGTIGEPRHGLGQFRRFGGLPQRAARTGRVELPLELSEQEAAQPPFALW